MPDAGTFVAAMESVSREDLGLSGQIEAASKSLEIMEPWIRAESENDDVKKIINGVREQNNTFYYALGLSTRVARQGQIFCEDALQLCEFVLDPDCTVEELQAWVQDMAQMAQKASADVQAVQQEFRGVRRGLIQMSNEITLGRANTAEKLLVAEEEKNAAEIKRESKEKEAMIVTGGAVVVMAGRVAFAAKVAALAITAPHAMIVLPVALPIWGIVAGYQAIQQNEKVISREITMKKCSDALGQLTQAASDVQALIGHTDIWVQYWSEMDKTMGCIKNDMDGLNLNSIKRSGLLRLKNVKRRLSSVQDEYSTFLTQMSHLQDLYLVACNKDTRALTTPKVDPSKSEAKSMTQEDLENESEKTEKQTLEEKGALAEPVPTA